MAKALDAQVGVATVILFTALILLGFFAMSTFLKTSEEIDAKGRATEEAATKGAMANFRIIEVAGYTGDGGVSTGSVTKLIVTLALAPGSPKIPYKEILMSCNVNETFITKIRYNDTIGASEDSSIRDNDIPDFGVLAIKEDTANEILEENEIIELHFWIEDSSGDKPLASGDKFVLSVTQQGSIPSVFRGVVPRKLHSLYIRKWT